MTTNMGQRRKKNGTGVLLLLLLGVGAFLLMRKPATGGPPPPPGAGPAIPGGDIGSVDVAQASLATHNLFKSIGDTLTLNVMYTASTKDSGSNPIPWNYGISWRYRNEMTNALVMGGFFNIGSRTNGTYPFGASDPVGLVFSQGTWTVQVTLHADNSSPTGMPLGDMPFLEDDALVIGFKDHKQAFTIV